MRFNNLGGLLQELKNKIDLSAFISRDMLLVQRGSRWIGSCPFHADNNPSFAIFPPKDGNYSKWGCHPCNLHGDLIDYVQRKHQCTIIESIEIIINITGFDASEYIRETTESEVLLERQYRYLNGVAKFFHDILLSSPPQMFFLCEERGLTQETLLRFLIGYCPSLEFAAQYIGEEGLFFIEPKRENWSNLFGGYILIPQFTVSGQVWGWYSRQSERKPKYISTSAKSQLYDANARLYGFSQARKIPDREKSKIVIVEGFFDVMMAQQNGIAAIGVCGTSLTDHHIQTLHDHAYSEATVVFDGDDAGRKAMNSIALKAHNIQGLNLKFGTIAGDPDELINEQGVEAFKKVLENALCSVEFVITYYSNTDLTTVTPCMDFYQHVLSYLAELPRYAFARQLGIDLLAHTLDIDPDLVLSDLDKRFEPPLASSIAELSVLSEFLMNPNAFVTYPKLRPHHFGYHIHQILFGIMASLSASGATISRDLLLHEIKIRRLDVLYAELINTLAEKDRSNVERFITETIDKANRKAMQGIFERAKADLCDLKTPISQSISHVIETATKMTSGGSTRQTIFSHTEATRKAVQIFEQRQLSSKVIVGLDAGPAWSKVMGWIKGLRGGRTHVIGALSGVGKSLVLLNWIYGISMRPGSSHAPGLVASMEMSEQENIVRLLAIDSGLPYDDIYCGRMNNIEDFNHLKESFSRLNEAPITWMTGQRTVPEIAIQARMLKAKGLLEYIAIDYIQLLNIMCYPNNMSQVDKYSLASQELEELAYSLDVPILMAAQLNRGAYQAAEPSGEHMGACLKIYQDAHVVYHLADRTDGMIGILSKNRDGASHQSSFLGRSYEPGKANLRVWEAKE